MDFDALVEVVKNLDELALANPELIDDPHTLEAECNFDPAVVAYVLYPAHERVKAYILLWHTQSTYPSYSITCLKNFKTGSLTWELAEVTVF